MKKFELQAELHAATCFLNSVFREWDQYRIVLGSEPRIEMPLGENETLRLPIRKSSLLGRFEYGGQYFVNEKAISFDAMIEIITQFFAKKFGTDELALSKFKARIFASKEVVQGSLIEREAFIKALPASSLAFVDTEQGLTVGHNFHPTPKSRDEFSDEDLRHYSPEFGGKLLLEWLAVDPSMLHRRSAESNDDRNWTVKTARQELPESKELEVFLSQGFVPVPMHPWQLKVLEKREFIAQAIRDKRIVKLGSGNLEWIPTSSLRSLYREDAPYMFKFSMSVKLTNSVRHLLVREVDRGLQLQDVLATIEGQKFNSRFANFHVIKEPAYLCFVDASGDAITESVVVCRENPFTKENSTGKAVLATLTQEAPLGGLNPLQAMITAHQKKDFKKSYVAKEWFKAFIDVALKPFLVAHGDFGIVLGAHQQNLILGLKDGFPVETYFRDCQGTGYTELGFNKFAKDVASITRENGNVLTVQMANALFGYYLILNSTFSVITALAANDWITEEALINDLRASLEILRTQLKDPAFLSYLLDQKTLTYKGNFICSFKNINENTTDDPLAIYTQVANPIAAAKEVLANA